MKKPRIPDEVLEFFREKGKAGGKKRAKRLSAKRRSEIARQAVEARWKKQKREAN
jgi:hypothetical protein